MLFNTHEFLLVFLPLVLVSFLMLRRATGRNTGIAFLVLASLFFYGWWNPSYVPLIVGSIAVNYGLAHWIARRVDRRERAWGLTAGVAFDLGLLGYFKYANFFVDNVEWALRRELAWVEVTLPIAISFFTFQQIAFLVSTRELMADHDPALDLYNDSSTR